MRKTAAGLFTSTLLLLSGGGPRPAGAERLVPAYDPTLHVKPPHAHYVDGTTGPLLIDADFRDAAARFRQANPRYLAAEGGVVQNGEILIIQGDSEILETDGSGLAIRSLPAIARRVIDRLGDHFQSITLWLTFDDRNSARAAAYEMTVKNEVLGLGPSAPVRDMSGQFGSNGVLRSMLNMKAAWATAGETHESWVRSGTLSVWGQESAHRWMMFMMVRDPRNGRISDALLGRDCAHYSRFVHTQASVHDGLAWKDNGNGTFTWTEAEVRYGDLDLYGMGLLAADEMPPFFFIDDIPNYKYPTCGREYDRTLRPREKTIQGTRVDVTIDDIIAANGERSPAADDRQDYWREANVIITRPTETADSPTPRALAERLNRARLWWEDWNRTASSKRLVICTQLSRDCGDPRSDVNAVTLKPSARAPGAGPLTFEVEIVNPGGRAATGIVAAVEATVGGQTLRATKEVGTLAPGARRVETVKMDITARLDCGTPMQVKAYTQSDFHYNRRKASLLVGAELRHADSFETESGWVTNPDGTDTTKGAVWERGQPEQSDLLARRVQPGTARSGASAWVTGMAAASDGGKVSFVREGRSTLQSPTYDTNGFRDPAVRYWVSFAGVRASDVGTLEASPQSRLTVMARSVDAAGAAGEWIPVDTVSNEVTTGWVQRTATLPLAAFQGGQIQLRFVAEDENSAQGGVEAAIDDVEITSNVPACYTAITADDAADGGCDCGVGGRPRGTALFGAFGALGAALLLRRRRRR